MTDEGGEGGLLNGHVVQLLLKLYQSIIVKKPEPENLSPSGAPIIHNVEEWLSGGNPFKESGHIN